MPYPSEGASNRYRVEQYLPFLKKEAIKFSLHPFWTKSAYKVLYRNGYYFRKFFFFFAGILFRTIDVFSIFRYDVVFIHREACPVGSAFFESAAFFLGREVIFDFDDAIFLPSSSRCNNFVEKFKNPGKVATIIKKSKYVICGNSFLADFSLRYNPSVVIIPTPIDTTKYSPMIATDNRPTIIGWMGSATTLDFLDPMKNVFTVLSSLFNDVEFKIIGGAFLIPGLSRVRSKSWSFADEIDDLRSMDIGIMPMPDNDWTRGKCGFKAILYMSMGIPCVCSPVGMNKEIIINGSNGFLATTQEDWVEKLSLLIKDSALRRKLGNAGRKTVEERYSLKANAQKYLEVLKNCKKVNCKRYGRHS